MAGGGAAGGEGNVVIAPGNGVQVLVATKPVDFRKGPTAWRPWCRKSLSADPFSGATYVFRAKRATGSSSYAGMGRAYACLPSGWRKVISAGHALLMA